MRLWTIQPPSVLGILEGTGRYRAGTAEVLANRMLAPEVPLEDDYTIKAYRWMARQMVKHIGPPPEGVEFPVWAWQRWGGVERPMPDLRVRSHGQSGTEMVRIELEVGEGLYLPSDFDLWFFAYGSHFLPHPPGAEARWNRALREAGCWGKWGETGELPVPLVRMKEDSWQAVFDLGCRRTSLTAVGGRKIIQATLWEITRDMVRGVRRFRCR